MKKSIRRILSGLLCAGVLALGIPAPSRALTLTAVNDSILPLSDSTMPARLGGEIYVPYSVFSQLGVSASSSDGVLDLSANGETLSFSPAEGYVYDQDLNSYSTPAYSMNGTTYVPVKLCCGKFGLSYSTLAVAGETVLRVTDGSALPPQNPVRSKTRSTATRAFRPRTAHPRTAPRQMAARQRSRTRLPFRRLRKSRRASRHGCT